MRDRQTRLVRLVRFFEMAKRSRETRLSRLSNEDATLARRELDLVVAMSTLCLSSPELLRTSHHRLSSIACERAEIRRKIDVENKQRLEAERRVRAAGRALTRVDAEIETQTHRRDLEEIRLAPNVRRASFGQV